MDAWIRRDMEKKMTSLSQQHFLDFPANVVPNQSLMKNTLIQFKPVASMNEVDFSFASLLSLTFSISVEGSRMRQALELSLFTQHKHFIFLLGVFTDENMQLFVSLFFLQRQ